MFLDRRQSSFIEMTTVASLIHVQVVIDYTLTTQLQRLTKLEISH